MHCSLLAHVLACAVCVTACGDADETFRPLDTTDDPTLPAQKRCQPDGGTDAAPEPDAATAPDDSGELPALDAAADLPPADAGSTAPDASTPSEDASTASRDASAPDSDASTPSGPSGDAGGPAGGADCASYCTAMAKICIGDNQKYADEATCLSSCARFPTTGAADAMRGNSFQCRSNHVLINIIKKGQPPATHCDHAGPTGGGACK